MANLLRTSVKPAQAAGITKAGSGGWQTTFAALKFYNYRLWFAGQLVSLVGTWMQSTAQGYLVYELTQSPAYLGIVAFASGLPSLIFMLYGGVVADRVPRRNLMVVTQSIMMVLAFILAALTFTHLVQPWHIIVLALALGLANAFDVPARQAFVLEMVDREHMGNAIALNSTMFQMGTIVGPASAGLLYAAVGPAAAFVLNGLSYLAVIFALLLMRLPPFEIRTREKSSFEELKDGLHYILHHPTIRILISIATFGGIFGMGYVTLMPAWAVDVLHGDATTYGIMLSARGVGAMAGALMVASLGTRRIRGRMLTVGGVLFPILLLLFSAVRHLPLSLLTLVGAGFGFMLLFNLLNSLIQHEVADELRGRVMGVYSLTIFGGNSLGSILAGGAAEHIGEPLTVAFSALIPLTYMLFVTWRTPRIRKLH